MPKLYEYFGLIILFYSNEHEPIHVHGKYQGTESKAEFIIDIGEIVEIRYSSVRGRRPLDEKQFKNFKTLVEHYAENVTSKEEMEKFEKIRLAHRGQTKVIGRPTKRDRRDWEKAFYE